MNPENLRILVVDPDKESGASIALTLRGAGYRVRVVRTLKRAVSIISLRDVDMIICALGVAGLSAPSILSRLRASGPSSTVLFVAPLPQVESAVRAMKDGAEDYLTKPLDPYELRGRVGRIMERRELNNRLADMQTALTQKYGLQSFVHQSPAMRSLVHRIAQVSPTSSTVLILGESGVGKELVAKAIHYNSPRRLRPYLAINCAALPANLIESELFGHERGSFTGAVGRSRGKFETADGGTILLDEIGEMDGPTQVKLLRVLEEREFMRVGGTKNIRVDVRVLAATNADLQRRIEDGSFREDLYFRLKVITLPVPPLRERAEDIPTLVQVFLDSLCSANRIAPKSLSSEALLAFQRYSWPGNVRELKNLLESLVVTVPGRQIDLQELPPAVRGERAVEKSLPRLQGGTTMREMERDLIRETLVRTEGNRTRAARLLQIGVRTLQRKIKEYGIP
jgi:DNA-binding NtrC family response regulator